MLWYRSAAATLYSSIIFLAALGAPAWGEEAPGTAFEKPVDQVEEWQGSLEPASVPEVLRLAAAASEEENALAELRSQRSTPGVPLKNGFARRGPETRVLVAAGVESTGAVQDGMGGGDSRSWFGRFVVEEAYAFRVRLDDVTMPEGARFWLHAGGVHLGPFGKELMDPAGGMWLPPAPGAEVVVEVEMPKGEGAEPGDLAFTVGEVMELVDVPASADLEPQVWTDCDIDATCIGTGTLTTIDMLREAVARLSFVDGGSSFLCSGGLINDKDPSGFRPFLLTANHCFDTQASASSLVAYFDYRTSTCNGSAPSLGSVPSVSGATLLATSPDSDFTFVELSGLPAGSSWLLGWTTTTPTGGTGMFRVSHPAGTAQKYSDAAYTGSSGIVCGGLPVTNFHYSEGVNGATTGGSSGSPVTVVVDGDARVVGQLLGVCHFPSWDDCNYDSYNYIDGAFAVTFPFIDEWINVVPVCDPDAFEPDDSSGAASPIASGSPQAHNICPAGDEDWVTFSLGQTSAVTIETSGASGDTRMWLFDSNLSQVEFDDDGGAALFSRIDRECGVDPLSAGTYFVKVDEFADDDEIESYAITYTKGANCGVCPTNLTLSHITINGVQSYRASGTITLGPSLLVDGTAIDVLAGDRVVITSGTEIGGSFVAGTHPSACSL